MDRDVFFSDTTKQLLIDYIKNYRIKNNEKIFRWGEKVAGNMVTYYVKKIAKIANLPNWITPHIFRHTFASRLVKKNVNLRIIQTLLGHCNIASTEIYTHIEKEKIKEEAQKAFLE
jgi:site-specific recombinase XerD